MAVGVLNKAAGGRDGRRRRRRWASWGGPPVPRRLVFYYQPLFSWPGGLGFPAALLAVLCRGGPLQASAPPYPSTG